MATRNLQLEQNALKTFTQTKGKLPSTPEDWSSLHAMAYGSDLPDEFKTTVQGNFSAAMGGSSRPQNGPTTSLAPSPTTGTPTVSDLTAAGKNRDQAYNRVVELGSGNEAMRVLQEAIKTKTGVAEAPIGESSIFQQAGVGGIGALSASLATRGAEIKTNFANFSNIVSQMSGTYKDMASTALFAYQAADKQYESEMVRLQKIEDDAKNYEQQISLLAKQHQNAVELAKLQKSTPTISEQMDLASNGFTLQDGAVIKKGANDIVSPSGNVYDWSTYNAVGTPEEKKAYIISVQNAINSVGKLNNEQELANYIQTNMAGSNITAQDVINASRAKGVGWEELLGILQKESNGGTSNVALKNNNFGGITWSKSYQDSHPNVTKGSARPSSEGGNYVKFETVQDGLEAQAEQFAKRLTTPSSDGAGSEEAQIAQSIFNGTSSLKVTDLPTKQRAQVNVELNKLKDQALQSGDIQGVIRASAGGKDVDATAVTSFEKAVGVLNQLGDLKANIEKEATGPIQGIIRSKNPYDTKAQLIKAQLSSIVPNLARGVYGEVGVLTDNDIANYSKTLPNLTSTKDITNAVLAMTVKSVQNSLESKIKIQAGLGRDVSGLGQVYTDVKAKADELLGQSGVGNGDGLVTPTAADDDYIKSLGL